MAIFRHCAWVVGPKGPQVKQAERLTMKCPFSLHTHYIIIHAIIINKLELRTQNSEICLFNPLFYKEIMNEQVAN